ncbi:MAG: 2-oxo acid dehydrogenase subunit E2 [Sphingomonadales bacterium]|nr:2-oxo acid dehydrogenase subunit E2 [Sphingomonadales bacterium]
MTVFRLPDLGEGLQDAEIVRWLVKEGDVIETDAPMVEVSTDKAVVEVPSPYSGKVAKLHGGEGDVIAVGAPLITFEVDGGEIPSDDLADIETGAASGDDAHVAKTREGEHSAQAESRGGAHTFLLPDLGEGLAEAEIVSWLVAVGDEIERDSPMVEVSTDKAVVEVPAPFSGQVVKLYAEAGEVVKTGAPLIDIETEDADAGQRLGGARKDSGGIVGELKTGESVAGEAAVAVGAVSASASARALARRLKVDLAAVSASGADGVVTLKDVRAFAENGLSAAVTRDGGPPKIGPAARAKAKELAIDPADITGTGPRNVITRDDILNAAEAGRRRTERAEAPEVGWAKGVKAAPKVRALARELGVDLFAITPTGHQGNVTLDDVREAAGAAAKVRQRSRARPPDRRREVTGEPVRLTGSRRIMAQAMARANAEVTNTSIFDEVDIGDWPQKSDITMRLIRAIVTAARAEPALNAWFDGTDETLTMHREVHLGVAVDSERGLFVPVIRNASEIGAGAARRELDRLRAAIEDQTIKSAEMRGATLTLSNFGMIAGLYGTTIVSPPEVAIVGIGRMFRKLVMHEAGIENRRHLPLSLSFDHRAVTGGEAARFLAAAIDDLGLPE